METFPTMQLKSWPVRRIQFSYESFAVLYRADLLQLVSQLLKQHQQLTFGVCFIHISCSIASKGPITPANKSATQSQSWSKSQV